MEIVIILVDYICNLAETGIKNTSQNKLSAIPNNILSKRNWTFSTVECIL
jgi:hypothetical protein